MINMEKLSDMVNIGPEVEKQLMAVGINSPEELIAAGSKKAWLKIYSIDSSACIHRLAALEGAVRGIKKSLLPDEVKEDLKKFYKEAKGR